MKKIFLLPAAAIVALSFQSCQNEPVDDSATQHRIDSMVNVRTMALRDSMMMECNMMVMSAATAYADSVMMAMAKGSKGGKTKPSTTTTPPKDDKTGISNRPGSDQAKPTVTNRPGAKNDTANQPKVNKRPGVKNPQ